MAGEEGGETAIATPKLASQEMSKLNQQVQAVPNLSDLVSQKMPSVKKNLDEDDFRKVLIGSLTIKTTLDRVHADNKILQGDRDTRQAALDVD